MKKIIPLLCISVLFFSISLSFVKPKEDAILPVVQLEEGESYYEVDISELGITTNNFIERFPKMTIIRMYPKFSAVYKDRVEQQYYSFDRNKKIQENCDLMQERYLFLLGYYGFIHDKQQYEIYGIPLSKVIVLASKDEVETKLDKYSIKETVLG